jgi:hypothetical protein
MAFGNFVFEAAACYQTQSLFLPPDVEGCELCKSNAAAATLCGSCADMIRRLVTIHSEETNDDLGATTGT